MRANIEMDRKIVVGNPELNADAMTAVIAGEEILSGCVFIPMKKRFRFLTAITAMAMISITQLWNG